MTSTIKVNKIEKESGSTLTVGGCGTTVTLACGAINQVLVEQVQLIGVQDIKTSPFTAENGKGFFVNTT